MHIKSSKELKIEEEIEFNKNGDLTKTKDDQNKSLIEKAIMKFKRLK